MRVQLNNDCRMSLDEGMVVFEVGAVGVVETPGERWARVRFAETISALIPAELLNKLE